MSHWQLWHQAGQANHRDSDRPHPPHACRRSAARRGYCALLATKSASALSILLRISEHALRRLPSPSRSTALAGAPAERVGRRRDRELPRRCRAGRRGGVPEVCTRM